MRSPARQEQRRESATACSCSGHRVGGRPAAVPRPRLLVRPGVLGQCPGLRNSTNPFLTSVWSTPRPTPSARRAPSWDTLGRDRLQHAPLLGGEPADGFRVCGGKPYHSVPARPDLRVAAARAADGSNQAQTRLAASRDISRREPERGRATLRGSYPAATASIDRRPLAGTSAWPRYQERRLGRSVCRTAPSPGTPPTLRRPVLGDQIVKVAVAQMMQPQQGR